MRVRLPFGATLLILTSLLLWVWSCTEPGEDITPHPAGWVETHQGRVQAVNYDFTSCGECHGTDLAGGELADGCSRESCHTADAGVYACDNCHGYLTTEPFENLAGDTSTDTLTVGAHTSHYTGANDLTNNVTCASCHIAPDSTSVLAATHMDTSAHAEVTFGALGDVTAVGTATSWDRTTGTCSDIYCHGDFSYERPDSAGIFITGNNPTMTWRTTPVEGDLCGTCHGLPPTGHGDLSGLNCGACHSSVLSASSNSVITGLDNHINGEKNRP